MLLSKSLNDCLTFVYKKLENSEVDWYVAGSCSLVLQNISLNADPNDLDIQIKSKYSPVIHSLLQPYALDKPHYSESDHFRSLLSHYEVGGIEVEFVADFSVQVLKSDYIVDMNILKDYSTTVNVNGLMIKVMPLAHEFVFNILRDRPDRYIASAEKMKTNRSLYFPALFEILKRNHLDEIHVEKLSALLGEPLKERKS
ncbi:nucleotidyltransferase domain-containing protein [Chengkuizengella axinellae]|uniref:Nucleotidyl transferase AbiEii/AbiGii toxin family protein n=1 Tax=Chengkuizengella axinellae TaxID=3064388 RepID=A0ABT9IWQ5_9BACL|nr:hypothetical protein [Chengkuizengella sp. 2205SS18-9]MDP5273788.1 hypothetical protein [Chengkuizengella sp. 2205SS18-9]